MANSLGNLVSKINSRASLDRSPKKNWVENAGGLPMYIRRIANHLHQEKGMTIGHAIATAVNACKKMCASGDTNWPGVQQVNAKSRSQACAAVASWEKKKISKVRVSKGLRSMPTDAEVGEILVGIGLAKRATRKRQSVDIHMSGAVSKRDNPRQMVFGWAQVARLADGSEKVDKQGDFIANVEDLEDAAYEFTLNSRDGGEMHIRKGVSRLVESFVSTVDKQRAMGIPPGAIPVGWWVGFKVDDPAVWEKVVKGDYPMFSVHGRGVRKAID